MFSPYSSLHVQGKPIGGTSTVAIRISINEFDSVVESINTQAQKHRTEDLFLVARHIRFHIRENSRTNEVTLGEFRDLTK